MMSFSLDTTTPLSFRDTRIAGKFYLIQIYALTHFFGGTKFNDSNQKEGGDIGMFITLVPKV